MKRETVAPRRPFEAWRSFCRSANESLVISFTTSVNGAQLPDNAGKKMFAEIVPPMAGKELGSAEFAQQPRASAPTREGDDAARRVQLSLALSPCLTKRPTQVQQSSSFSPTILDRRSQPDVLCPALPAQTPLRHRRIPAPVAALPPVVQNPAQELGGKVRAS